MRKYLFLFAFLSVIFVSRAQSVDDKVWNRTTVDQVTGNLFYLFQYIDIKGSQFLNDKWMPASIFMYDHTIFKNLQLKFDEFNNQFALNKNDTAYRVSSAAPEIHLYSNRGDSLVFKNRYTINSSITADKYLQVLAEGKTSFLKFTKKDVEEYSEYGDATKYKRFVDREEYFFLKGGAFTTTRLSKGLETLLNDKWDKVSQYLSQNNLNGKDEKSFAAAIVYYNSL